ncbi:TAXI family TRAP transporter solute-binding subunit [Polycladidibacter stylochi]|uniref:TAXI family TRAP transporter solute-binding subunit n=1 Tax=Polycladidibacter stylochi TaxID=1807766 RepID=UPI00083521F8|nr:TAXI family TRAP transporter solute-binding subunit [Pseudovibrio stylochi]
MKRIGMILAASAIFAAGSAFAETRITYKAAKTSSSYYQMAVQIAEAMKKSSDGNIIVTVEESQGSVQNVLEASVRQGNYVFTSPPSLVGLAQQGKAMFAKRPSPRFQEIRALYPIPSLSMHFVVRADSGVNSFADLAGKKILIGKGSFGAKEGAKYIKLFGLEGKVKLADVELSNAVPALKNRRIDGFVTSGSFPAPNVIEAAAGTGVKVLSLSDAEIAKTKRTKVVIPAGTYSGQEQAITTTSLPVIAYSTTQMDNDTAYAYTKNFWAEKKRMGENAAWWNGVTPDLLANIKGKIHPGALKYYDEAGFKIRDDQR